MRPDGSVSDGDGDEKPSFFQEYKYKLENIYSKFYTKKAAELAKERQAAAAAFYNGLYGEVSSLHLFEFLPTRHILSLPLGG